MSAARAVEALKNVIGLLKAAGADNGTLLNALARVSGEIIGEVAAEGFEESLVRDFGKRVRMNLKR